MISFIDRDRSGSELRRTDCASWNHGIGAKLELAARQRLATALRYERRHLAGCKTLSVQVLCDGVELFSVSN